MRVKRPVEGSASLRRILTVPKSDRKLDSRRQEVPEYWAGHMRPTYASACHRRRAEKNTAAPATMTSGRRARGATGDHVAAATAVRASTNATTSAAAKLLMYGINRNAVASTPAIDPVVLMQNTLPAPASPSRWPPRASSTATSRGFIAETAASGTKSST